MVINCEKGMYLLERNYRDAFNLEEFQRKYFEEFFDKYEYIVGDISSSILRLKGFDTNPKSKNYFKLIDEYLDKSCAFGCPFFVLKRIHTQEEYKKLENIEMNNEVPRIIVKDMPKENFDKESLILDTNPASNPHIVIEPEKLQKINLGTLPQDLKDDKGDLGYNKSFGKPNGKKPEEKVLENVETYVSASPDFDPSKKQNPKKNNNRQNQNNRNQNNNNKQNQNNNNNNKQNQNNRNNNNNNKQFNKNNNQNNNKNKENKQNRGK